MIKINLKFSCLSENLFSCKKIFLAFTFLAFTSLQGICSTSSLACSFASEATVYAPGRLVVASEFARAIAEEYAVFKTARRVAAPVDFLVYKTEQLKSSIMPGLIISTDDKKAIALTIQYILRGHVFPIEPALPSETVATNSIYTVAGILSSSVYGLELSQFPEFVSTMSGDDYAYHRSLVQLSVEQGVSSVDAEVPAGLQNFVAALVHQEKNTITSLSKGPTFPLRNASPMNNASVATTAAHIHAASRGDSSSDDEGGCCSCIFGKKKKKTNIPAINGDDSLRQPLLGNKREAQYMK